MLSRLVAHHSAKPSGLLGRFIFGRYLDRANRQMNSVMHEALGHDAGSDILEIGFGGGAFLLEIAAHLEGGHIDGVEVSEEMLDSLKRRISRLGLESRVGLHQASVEKLPFDDERFDFVCSAHTIYFWSDLVAGLAEINRVTRPGGVLVLGFSSKQALVDSGWVKHGFKAYDQNEIEQACLASGFKVDRIKSIPHRLSGEYHALRAVKTG